MKRPERAVNRSPLSNAEVKNEWNSLATLTEVFPFFFLSCKANARV